MVAASGTSGAGKAAKPHLLGSEIMGNASAYGVGGVHRHTPEITQNLSALVDGTVSVSFTPLLVPMPRGILATCSARLTADLTADEVYDVYAKAYADEPFIHLLPAGPVAADQVGHRLQRRPPAGDGRRGRPTTGRRRCRRQPVQGHRRRCRPVHEPRARPRRRPGPLDGRNRPMSITTPAGFRAAGVAAGLKSTGAKDVALVVNDGPTFDSASVFTANRCKANPVLWSQEVVKDGIVRAVFLNSGGANCYTGPDGFQTTHAVAETRRRAARDRCRRRRRLLDRPDRPHQRPRSRSSPASTAAYAALAADGGQQAAEAIMTTDSVSKQVVVEGAGWSIGGMAKGAGMLAPAAGHHAGRPHHRRRRTGRRPRRRAARGDPGQLRPARLRRLHVDQRHGHACWPAAPAGSPRRCRTSPPR